MSTKTDSTTDGIDHDALDRAEQLRHQVATGTAALDQQTAELAALDAALAEQKAAADRAAQVASLRARYDTATADYPRIVEAADTAVAPVEPAAHHLGELVNRAVDAENDRRDAAHHIQGLERQLQALGEHVTPIQVAPPRLCQTGDDGWLRGAQHIAVVVGGEDAEVNLCRLDGRKFVPSRRSTPAAAWWAGAPGHVNPHRG